jgi:predicted transglutaminase-like cysteine proteinase
MFFPINYFTQEMNAMRVPRSVEEGIEYVCHHSYLCNEFPIFKYIIQKATSSLLSSPLKMREQDPDLLESCTILSKHLASISLTFSVISLSLVPTLCSAGVIIILKRTGRELQKKRSLIGVVNQLKKTNKEFIKVTEEIKKTNLETTTALTQEITELKEVNAKFNKTIEKLNKLIKDHQITGDSIKSLQKEESNLLLNHQKTIEEYNKVSKQLETVKDLFEKERQGFAEERRKLTSQVNRLSKVRS